jgi:hypothetical protein
LNCGELNDSFLDFPDAVCTSLSILKYRYQTDRFQYEKVGFCCQMESVRYEPETVGIANLHSTVKYLRQYSSCELDLVDQLLHENREADNVAANETNSQ